jgi:hypothetical protein
MESKQDDTWRHRKVKGVRIIFDPKWSPSMPYCLFENGHAIIQKGTLQAAKLWFIPHVSLEDWYKAV